MIKQVSVLDSRHHILNSTYAKRAKQLVKNGRARWISENAIILDANDNKEEKFMESTTYDTMYSIGNGTPLKSSASYADSRSEAAEASLSDAEILKLAEQRYAQKSNLWKQVRDSLLILFTMTLCTALYPEEGVAVLFLFAVFWLGRLTMRVIRFMRPTFYKGIGWYIRNYRKNKIESEYAKLKALNKDQVLMEYENAYN